MPSDKVTQEEVLRSAQFDLLRQLQKAVRTVILTATVSNSCVNCSHSLCGQLFRLIRSCLLAGCRRFHGAKLDEDFLFLLMVPEFIGAFKYDMEFIAHLCVSHNIGSFVRQLFEDRRASHFYCDCAIMRDEELHLAFVSSLMALEPVNFHPDSPDLAQQCLSASLDNLRLIPVQWVFEGSGKLEDHVPASRPDKVVPRSDMGALRSKPGAESSGTARSLWGFIGGAGLRQKKAMAEDASPSCEVGNGHVEEPQICQEKPMEASEGEPSAERDLQDQKELPEAEEPATDLSEKLEEAALALNETEELVRQLEADQSRATEEEERPEAALLSESLLSCLTLELEDNPDEGHRNDSPTSELPGEVESLGLEAGEGLAAREEQPETNGSAADLGMDIADAFGMGLGCGAPVPEVDISVRDLVAAGHRARQRPFSRAPAPVPEDEALLTSPRRSGSPGPGEQDEALDVIASLEGLWMDSRKDTARRLMRASFSSVTSQNSVSSVSSQGHSPSAPHLLHLESGHSHCADGHASDSESESSSRSVSNTSSTSISGSQAEKLPPFLSHGVHLEWKLKMHARLPKDVQVSRQRGLCPECRQRLPSSLFQGPRYCHYLGYYFCNNCHTGDIRVIPARVAERWDFEPKKVCSAVAKYLDLQVNQALVPITCIRQTKVSSQQILTEIHKFRQKLSRIKQVVADYGCVFQDVLSNFLSQLDAHVARGHDFYAMQDLIRIELQGKNCPLYINISRCVMECAKHIHSCPTCARCAETCPICDSSVPVYPFEIETFYACPQCRKAFHKACFRRAGSSCPFCLTGSSHAVSAVQAR